MTDTDRVILISTLKRVQEIALAMNPSNWNALRNAIEGICEQTVKMVELKPVLKKEDK